MFTSRSSWLKMPPSTTPGASSAPWNSIGTVALIAWSIRTRRRSTWIASPRTGWRWTSLISTFVDAPLDRHLDHLGGVRERVAQDAGVDREGLRILAAAVDHARHEALAAHASRRPRPLRGAALELQAGGFGGGHRAASDGSETGSDDRHPRVRWRS